MVMPGRKRRMIGWAFIAGGLLFGLLFPILPRVIASSMVSADTGTPVSLRVTKLHSNDGSYAPEFEVVEGEFAGRRTISSVSSNPPVHMEGEVVNGFIDPASGAIQSEGTLRAMGRITTILTTVGLIVSGVFISIGIASLIFARRAAQAGGTL